MAKKVSKKESDILMSIPAYKHLMEREAELNSKGVTKTSAIECMSASELKKRADDELYEAIQNLFLDMYNIPWHSLSPLGEIKTNLAIVLSIEHCKDDGWLESFYQQRPWLNICVQIPKSYKAIGAPLHAAYMQQTNEFYLWHMHDKYLGCQLTVGYEELLLHEDLQKILVQYIRKHLPAIMKTDAST